MSSQSLTVEIIRLAHTAGIAYPSGNSVTVPAAVAGVEIRVHEDVIEGLDPLKLTTSPDTIPTAALVQLLGAIVTHASNLISTAQSLQSALRSAT